MLGTNRDVRIHESSCDPNTSFTPLQSLLHYTLGEILTVPLHEPLSPDEARMCTRLVKRTTAEWEQLYSRLVVRLVNIERDDGGKKGVGTFVTRSGKRYIFVQNFEIALWVPKRVMWALQWRKRRVRSIFMSRIINGSVDVPGCALSLENARQGSFGLSRNFPPYTYDQ